MVESGGEAWHGTVEAHGNYPVGSGDAFLAGLLTALADDAIDDPGAWVPADGARPRGRGGQRRGPRRGSGGSRART